MAVPPRKCAQCNRPYNASFPACPFCKSVPETGSRTAGMKVDYVALAEAFTDQPVLHLDFSVASVAAPEASARLLLRLQRPAEALLEADNRVAATPQSVEARQQRAYILCQLKAFEEGLSEYDRAIAPAPANRDLWMEKAVALDQAGQKEESSALIEKALADPAYAEEYDRRNRAMFDALMGQPPS